MNDYILITAAHNEEAFIEHTCRSVLAQTRRPRKWIVVNDASHDRTAEIVERYREIHPDLIELLCVRRPSGRDFRNKVRAFDVGFAQARSLDFAYVGNLDADISLPPDYYATMLQAFESDPRLGITGGIVASNIGGHFVLQTNAQDSVAGAIQLFRRKCFEDIGGYAALKLGGIDTVAEVTARMQGWTVRTFDEVQVLEHRRTGTATAPPVSARFHEGRRIHSLGYSFPFFLARCLWRLPERPRVIGSLATLLGFLASSYRREPVLLPQDVVSYLRQEQRKKLRRLLKLERPLLQGD